MERCMMIVVCDKLQQVCGIGKCSSPHCTVADCGAGFDECGDNIIVPGKEFQTAQDFMKGIPPPGFEGYNFLVVSPDELEEGETCFNSSQFLAPYLSTLLVACFIALLVST